MPPVPALPAVLSSLFSLFAIVASGSAHAEEPAAGDGVFGLGLDIGMGFVILLAVLIAISVLSKLAIVFGLVPRRPETSAQALVHAMANFVGGLTRPRSRRGRDLRADDR